MGMLPIDPHIKVAIESVFLCILLWYFIMSIRREHLTASICVALSVPLLVDVFIFHALRPIRVWCYLNVPFILAVLVFVYVKILRKGWNKFVKKLSLLVTLLCGG